MQANGNEEKTPLLSVGSTNEVSTRSNVCINRENRNDLNESLDLAPLFVVYFITLLSEASRGLFLASQWPYLERLGGSRTLLGYFVASFSLGRMLSTIPLGFMSDLFSIKIVFFWCTVLQILGHFLYCLGNSVWILLGARLLVGFGSATMSVARAHITKTTTVVDRTKHFGYLSAVQFIGFAVLPLASGILAELPSLRLGAFVFDPLTSPGWTLLVANFICLFLIAVYYYDPGHVKENQSSKDSNGNNSTTSAALSNRPNYSVLAACLFVNVCFRGIIAELETVSSPLMIDMYHVSVADTGFIIGMLGCFGLAWYLALASLSKFLGDHQLTFIGLVLLFVGCLFLAQPFIQPSLTVFIFDLGLLWSVAYPIGQTAVLSLFSKVLKDVPVGGFLGVFSALGSFARIAFSILAGTLWSLGGFRSVFTCGGIFVIASLLVFTFSFSSFTEVGYG
eukprot:jgi/Galph1/5516/GphlegSOOS_G4150.1